MLHFNKRKTKAQIRLHRLVFTFVVCKSLKTFLASRPICDKYKNLMSKTTCSMALVLAIDVASDSGPLPSFSQILNLECHMVNIFYMGKIKTLFFWSKASRSRALIIDMCIT